MISSDPSNDYLLLLRNTQLENRLSLDEMQGAMREFNDWFERWKQAGRIKGGQPLGDGGRVITGAKRTVADGPFAESKEAVGGYILVQAESLDEAERIAADWPLLKHGCIVEVRPIIGLCATMQLVNAEAARVGA